MLPEFKQRYQDLLFNLHYTPPSLFLERNMHNQEYFDMLVDKENFTAYAGASRDLMLGYWLSHKLVYKISTDTIRFLEDEFHIELCKMDFNLLYQQACKETIYIEFPNGASASGAFCGCVPFTSKEFTAVGHACPLAISMIRNNDTHMNILYAPGCNLQECLDQAPKDNPFSTAQSLICKTIAYIGYISEMADALGTVLIENKQPYRCYDVLPIPFKDSLVDFSSATGWIQSGLCNYMGFLSRQNMVTDFIASLKGYTPADFVLSSEHPSIDEFTPLLLQSTISWEENKVIYQYSNEIAHVLIQLYGRNLLSEGMHFRLMQFLPHQTVVLLNSDSGALCMISMCQIENQSPGLFFVSLHGGNQEISIIPFEVSPISKFGPNAVIPPHIYTALCAYIHILNVLEKRTLKKIRTNTFPDNTPAPCQALTSSKTQPGTYTKLPEILRIGAALVDESPLLFTVPVSLFELTPKTIKAIPKKEIHSRCGFHMPPHIRCAHPHNYWVGRGEGRHLEVRYLKSIKVNAKKSDFMPTTVIRNIT